ncbi:ABC transporter ATP-binding protein [Sedimenticola sp.]|uniref:ABC transporter ATP-binding protein n=1 Tax=Sedimenticola sp. TaxID=1940285 RepID=UPI0025879D87|nr:ATP-binding cassette domain-containing protein [Sedimenticola sp.]MCW8902862.1 ATP-binding cassette domain-containing protein [Sedimenticola sp.]
MSRLILRQFQGAGLEPVDLTIDAGECITLTGPSGSGKTRLLRAIADLDPHSGTALFDQQAVDETAPPEWRRHVGLLPAESHWWHDRVAEHFIGSGARLLSELGLDEACLEWQIARLSSGERQRLALARLLDRQPAVLLLDEPTANLDPENGDRVERLVQHYAQQQGAAVLWVSHDPRQRRRVGQRHLIIRDRRIEAEAT